MALIPTYIVNFRRCRESDEEKNTIMLWLWKLSFCRD